MTTGAWIALAVLVATLATGYVVRIIFKLTEKPPEPKPLRPQPRHWRVKK